MLDMLMKQILGDVDMDAIKNSVQQFALKFAAMAATIDRIEAKVDALALSSPARLALDASQDGTVDPILKESNHDDRTNATNDSAAGSCQRSAECGSNGAPGGT